MALDRLHPPPRAHAAEHVFEQLARAILVGDLAKGEAMPPERILVERFGVSRIIVRQAMHRLAEIGLVRVRQGGSTIVLDPAETNDLRVLGLFYRLADEGGPHPFDVADIIEKQYVQGLSIVEIAARRASRDDLEAVARIAHETDPSSDLGVFEERFWRLLAVACKNRIFRIEVTWWYETLTRPPVPEEVAASDGRVRIGFYRELIRRLIEKDSPTEYYLAVTRPLLELVVGRAAGGAP